MAAGDIGSVLSSVEFASQSGPDIAYPIVFKLSDNVVCIAYNRGGDPYYRTFEINSDGTIDGSINAVCLDYQGSGYHVPCHITGDLYASVHQKSGTGAGVVRTTNIYGDGSISPVSGYTFESNNIRDAWICKVSDNICAVSYRDNVDTYTYIKTVGINDNGGITGVIDARPLFQHGVYTQLIGFTNNIVVLVCRRGDDWYMYTVPIQSNGSIGAIISGCHLYNSTSLTRCVLKIYDNVVVVGYRDICKTIGINDTGLITGCIDTYDLSSQGCTGQGITHVYKNIYAVVYEKSSSPYPGYIETININENGSFDGSIDERTYIHSHEYLATVSHVQNNIYAIAHVGYSSSGWIRTIDIETPSDAIAARPHRFTGGMCHRWMR